MLAPGALAIHASPGFAQSATATNADDDAGRLRTTSYSDGKAVGYALDAAGNRTSTAEGALPTLNVAQASATEGGTLVFAVTKTGTATGTITVDCGQTNVSATAGSDYTASTQMLTFLIAETSKNCNVPSLQDTIYEGPHTFSALLQNPTGSVKIGTSGAIGTITDNDTPPSFAVTGGSAAEGSPISSRLPRRAVRSFPTASALRPRMAAPRRRTAITPPSTPVTHLLPVKRQSMCRSQQRWTASTS